MLFKRILAAALVAFQALTPAVANADQYLLFVRVKDLRVLEGSSGQSAQFGLSTSSLNFSSAGIGTSSTLAVALTNTGQVALGSPTITVSGSGFSSTHNCPTGLAPGAGCVLNVSLRPESVGFLEGSVSVQFSNTKASTLTLSGQGTEAQGITPVPVLTGVTPASLLQGDASTLLTFSGQHFSASTYSLLRDGSEVSAPSLSVLSDTQISVSAAGLSSGSYSLRNDNGTTASVPVTVHALYASAPLLGNTPNQSTTLYTSVSAQYALQSAVKAELMTGATVVSTGIAVWDSGTAKSTISFAASTAPGSYTLRLKNASDQVVAVGSLSAVWGEATLTSAATLDFGTSGLGDTPVVRAWSFRNTGTTTVSLGLSGLPAAFSQSGNTCIDVAVNAYCDISVALNTATATSVPSAVVTLTATTGTIVGAPFQVAGAVAQRGFTAVSPTTSATVFNAGGAAFDGTHYYLGLLEGGTNQSVVYSSPDAVNWTRKVVGPSNHFINSISVSTSGRVMAATGGGCSAGSIFTTDDKGVTWTNRGGVSTCIDSMAAGSGGVAMYTTVVTTGVYSVYKSVNDGTSWSAVTSFSTGGGIGKVATDKNGTWLIGSHSSQRISRDNGVTWNAIATPRQVSGMSALRDLQFLNGRFWATGSFGEVCSYDAAGVDAWTCSITDATKANAGIGYSNGTYLVLTSSANVAYVSTDAVNWTLVAGASTGYMAKVATGNGKFVFSGTAKKLYYASMF